MEAMAETLPSICYRKRVRFLVVAIAASLAACSTRTPGERERALGAIPAGAQVILAADGPALATPALRAALDSLAPHVPPSLRCVVEVAQTSREVALGGTVDAGVTIVVLTRAAIARCPALSRIGEDVYVATIGGGALAADRDHSVLAASVWERARPYLVQEPIALAAELPELRVVAVAQPDPLDAWLAIDAVDAAAVALRTQDVLDRYRAQSSELAAKLKLSRTGTQVKIEATHLTTDDLVRVLTGALRVAEGPAALPAAFTCAAPGNGVVSCRDGTSYKVASIAAIVHGLAAHRSAPVIGAGDIIGLRLLDDAPPLLHADDVILGVDSHRIETSEQLARLADTLGHTAAVAVRRDGRDAIFELSE
jgi:hypothetical protein